MPDSLQLRTGYRSRTDCTYLDFYVNGSRLSDLLKINDFIPPLGWLSREVEDHFRRMLIRKEPSDFQPERIPLFVCPECVDYGCGVGTVRITREDNLIIWSDFRLERDYDDDFMDAPEETHLRFSFNASEYYQLLTELQEGEQVVGERRRGSRLIKLDVDPGAPLLKRSAKKQPDGNEF